MLVKAISNKKRRDITINKIYPVIIKEDNDIRIIDDFGGLSIYELDDFQVYKKNINSYTKYRDSLVYSLIDYPSFLENYYNDNKKAMSDVVNSQINIFEEDLNAEELEGVIKSENYSSYEKIVFIEAVKNKLTNELARSLANYLQKKYQIEQELLLPICKLLSKYQIQEVYDLFLNIMFDNTMNNESVQNIIIEYFNSYYEK
ncbi:hypothetical protein [Granulicatella seriolae]|uniref:Uncharacterized protein n=1 Tax=Granulicatella seriolae TaxID=2967226 RepID=A0ABT1WMV3_9LACT|nr:hypothetical protein [Granulicatella seriolae]